MMNKVIIKANQEGIIQHFTQVKDIDKYIISNHTRYIH